MSPAQKCPQSRAQRILDEVDAQLNYRLAYVLKAIDLLAESQRVLTALSDAAIVDKDLDSRIRDAVDAWLEPIVHNGESGYAVLANLARVAVSMADELVASATVEVDRRDRAQPEART